MAIVSGVLEIILYVQDMQKMVHFYRDILGLPLRDLAGEADFSRHFWVEFETGACTLALHGGGEGRLGQDAPRIVFQVADVETARQALVEKGIKMGHYRIAAPGVKICEGSDPEGNPFSIESRQAVTV
jgi:catechol 2,3-dioxygenase-like lactoylglutathione lyase family enzyme